MTIHVTARLAWHDHGWDGRVCQNPVANTFCVGCYSFPGDQIAKGRDLAWEQAAAGTPLKSSQQLPPCVFSINAFGRDAIRAYAKPPEFFRDSTQTRYWDLPPASVCTWPYELMYLDEVKKPQSEKQV